MIGILENMIDYDAQDWEECCEDIYDSIQDSDNKDAWDTLILQFSPLTSYFVLILIFSAICLICAIIPFDIRFKTPVVALFGLATTITGIFLARKSAITMGSYLEQFGKFRKLRSQFAFACNAILWSCTEHGLLVIGEYDYTFS